MKLYAVFFALLLGSVSALPTDQMGNAMSERQVRFVADIIVSVIENFIQIIVDAGLDPLVVERADLDYALPVPTIFNVHAHVTDLLFRGLSNVIINDLTVNVLTLRVTFDVSLPEILLNVVDSEVDANLFDANLRANYRGRLVLQNIAVTGDIRARIGIITGISITDMDLTFKLGRIDSQLNLDLLGKSYSNALNTFLGETIPTTLNNFETDINTLISIVGKEIVESML